MYSGEFPSSTNMQQSSAFTPSQLLTLKSQIMAFKLLSSQIPLPPNLQRSVLSYTEKDQIPLQEAILTEGHLKLSESLSAIINEANGRADHVKFFNPYAKASLQSIVPSLTPMFLENSSLFQEKERQLKARIEARIIELESLPASLPAELKLKATIELKSLKLFDLQKKVRSDVLKSLQNDSNLIPTHERLAFQRKPKKISVKELRIAEKLEHQQRLEHSLLSVSSSKSSVGKGISAVSLIISHGKEFQNAQKANANRRIKLWKSISSYHTNIEKEESKRLEKLAKERLKALKADDEEAYMKLIDSEKDTRLTHLLKQTGEFLNNLTQKVISQQSDAASFDARGDIEHLQSNPEVWKVPCFCL